MTAKLTLHLIGTEGIDRFRSQIQFVMYDLIELFEQRSFPFAKHASSKKAFHISFVRFVQSTIIRNRDVVFGTVTIWQQSRSNVFK